MKAPDSILNRIEFVLVAPKFGGNIGSTARAMKNMGFGQLSLVSPVQGWLKDAKIMAPGAEDILEKARVVDNIHSAIEKATYVVGTTRRGGEGRHVATEPTSN